jgi:hypothetical protein
MTSNEPFARVAAAEELVAAACAAVAEWVPDCESELRLLAAEHLRVAVRFAAHPQRWLKLRMAMAAMLAAAVGTKLGALGWLRAQEQRLVEGYLALEASPTLDGADRQELRRVLVPAAFERFSRVDQLIMTREEGVYA